MNLNRIEKLIKLLRANSVSHFKSLEIEVRIDTVNHTFSLQSPIVATPAEVNTNAAASVPSTGAAIPPVEVSIPHHVNEVADLLKLSDEQLVDKMFPDYSHLPDKAD